MQVNNVNMFRNGGTNCMAHMNPSEMLHPMLNPSPPFPHDIRSLIQRFSPMQNRGTPPGLPSMQNLPMFANHSTMENYQAAPRFSTIPDMPRMPMPIPPPPPSEQHKMSLLRRRKSHGSKVTDLKFIPMAIKKAMRPPSPVHTHKEELSREREEAKQLLLCRKAFVERETAPRVRSVVWKYMGNIRVMDTGKLITEWVACMYCNEVYPYRDKSRGTSILRPHACPDVLPIKRQHRSEKDQREKLKKRLELHQRENLKNSENAAPSSTYDLQKTPWNLKLAEGEGRNQQRELTPEGEDRKPVMPNPPPLKEHIMNSPSPQAVHPVSLHQGTPVSGVLGGGGLVNNVGGRSRSSAGGCASPPPTSTKDGPPQLLCVRWGNFDSNIVSMFSKLRSQETFVDVTIWCEGEQIKCHKMILSACSVYFEKMLTEVSNPHPVIVLKDMRFWEIQALVEFMYRGEVSVHQEKLQSLLRAAESLQIKGLGSPSNEIGLPVDGQNAMDEEMSNSTMDMTTNSSLNNSNSHLHNHINSSIKDDGPNSNSSSNSHTLHTTHHLGAAANNNNSNNNHQAPWQKFGLTTPSNMMGIDLSNHSGSGALSLSSLHGSGLPLPLSLSAGSPQSVSGSQGSGCGQASKRRKKETPRRIDLPRTAGMPLPAFNSTMGSEMEEDDDAASEDSMAAHERNHVDGLKMDLQHDQTYGDDEECDGQENYEENDPGAQGEDDISSEHGDEMDDDQDGALSLRVSNLSDSERMDRERSRKGNPMKKMLGIGNNNNNNEGGPQNLIHNVSSGGD